MDERSTGIILRTRPLTETSLIVHWLTPELGRVATVAKGARKARSPFLGKLDLYYEADFSFHRARRSTLHTLREVSVRTSHPYLRTDLAVLRQAAQASRRIERITEEETPLPEIHALLRGFLEELAKSPISEALPAAFESKLLRELGLWPDMTTAPVTPGSRRVMEQLAALEWGAVRNLKLSPAQVAELSSYLDRMLRAAVS